MEKLEAKAGGKNWMPNLEDEAGGQSWRPKLVTMYGNQWAQKYVWTSCMDIVFEFVVRRGTDFQEVGGTAWR